MVRGNPRRGTPAPALEVSAGTVVCAMRGWASDAPEADDGACLAVGFGALRLVCDRLLLRGGQVGCLAAGRRAVFVACCLVRSLSMSQQ